MTSSGNTRNPRAAGAVTRWAWLPLPVFLAATALCLALNSQGVFQPWWLLNTLSFVFSGAISILVAYLAARAIW